MSFGFTADFVSLFVLYGTHVGLHLFLASVVPGTLLMAQLKHFLVPINGSMEPFSGETETRPQSAGRWDQVTRAVSKKLRQIAKSPFAGNVHCCRVPHVQ